MGEPQHSNSEILKLLNTIISQNNEIKSDIDQIKKDLSNQSRTIEIINCKVAILENENTELKNKLLAIERKSKRNNFIIFGVKEDVADILTFVINIVRDTLNILISNNDINNIYRIGQKAAEKSRPIILELTTNLKKQEISRALPKLKNTGIRFANDLLPQDREQQKLLHKHLKEAKDKNHNARIFKNKLIINGVTYTYQDLKNTDEGETENHVIEVHSNPASSVNVPIFPLNAVVNGNNNVEENNQDHTEIAEGNDKLEIREKETGTRPKVVTPGTTTSSTTRSKRNNIVEEKEYTTRTNKKQKM